MDTSLVSMAGTQTHPHREQSHGYSLHHARAQAEQCEAGNVSVEGILAGFLWGSDF